MHQSIYSKHPDWAYLDENGNIVNYNGYVHTCINGGFQNEFAKQVLTELLKCIPFDGVYCNMGSFSPITVDYSYNQHGPCHCENCQRLFAEAYNMTIPQRLDKADRASMAYYRFGQQRHAAHRKQISEHIKAISPSVAFCSQDYNRQESNTECLRTPPHWQYSASSIARTIASIGKGGIATDTDMLGFYHRHVSLTPAWQRLRLYQALSNFAGIDFYIFGRPDTRPDTSAFNAARQVFAYAAQHQNVLYGARSIANVLVVKESFQFPNDEERGFIRVLTESHIPFDEVLLGGLFAKDFSQYKLIILPDKERLEPRAADKLNSFVSNGGRLLTSGKLPLGSGGKPLECLGIEHMEQEQDSLGATILLTDSDKPHFPSMVNRSMVPLTKTYRPLQFDSSTILYGAFCDCEPFGPPEICYAQQPPTAYCGLSRHPFGRGEAFCLPWHAAGGYYRDGFDVWFCYLKDVLALCGAQSMEVNLHPCVELTVGAMPWP